MNRDLICRCARRMVLALALATTTLATACSDSHSESPAHPGSACDASGGTCLLGRDAGASSDASAAPDTACIPVLASAYDQSCDADTDCVGVGEVPSCSNATCVCPTAAINKSANAQYSALLAQVTAAYRPQPCNCPCLSGAICRGGVCQAAYCGPPPGDTLPSCADAGGTCSYSANSTCNAPGPSDACAYPDEHCCIQ
jgi:hypothetical protein